MNGSVSTSAIVVRVSPPTERSGSVQALPIPDGHDVVSEAFEADPAHSPEWLLASSQQLLATNEPHEVELAEAKCTVGCCGVLRVTIRSEGDAVIWENWRDAHGPDPDLPSFRFDAEAYAA